MRKARRIKLADDTANFDLEIEAFNTRNSSNGMKESEWILFGILLIRVAKQNQIHRQQHIRAGLHRSGTSPACIEDIGMKIPAPFHGLVLGVNTRYGRYCVFVSS